MPFQNAHRMLVARTPRSAELYRRALKVMPGGNTRTCVHQDPYPLTVERADGARFWDVDGNEYIDLYFNGLSLIHGHAHPAATEAIARQAARGTAWAGASREQIELAELLCERIPSAELVRFCVSGSEAGMLAVSVARQTTGRRLIVRTRSGYHGSYDGFSETRSGDELLIVDDADVEQIEHLLAVRGEEIAAVFVELASVSTGLAPERDYFERLRAATSAQGVLLVFDECITFRHAYGGLQSQIGVQPDLTMVAKFIGGGLPLGALAGRAELLRGLDPRHRGALYHSGSFNGYVAACAAGLATLRDYTPDVIDRMNEQADRLARRLCAQSQEFGLQLAVERSGSLIGIQPLASCTARSMSEASLASYRQLQLECLTEGLYFQPSEGVFGLASVFDESLLDDVEQRFLKALARASEHWGEDREAE